MQKLNLSYYQLKLTGVDILYKSKRIIEFLYLLVTILYTLVIHVSIVDDCTT